MNLADLIRVIVQGLNRFCEAKRGQPMVIAGLKWLDDNLDGLMSLGCQLLNQESQVAELISEFSKLFLQSLLA